ncbi:MAG: hypothetical protein LBK53_03165 [Heliobacteriaceae bacterium]|jgi:tetratricopeptide (TPR) repeat protein|nr:hypothetical protein [Heliobacteriaceae bacterium]
MKKYLLLSVLFLSIISCRASELTDDYIDIAAGYCISGNYSEALGYLNRVLRLEPANSKAIRLKNTLERVTNPKFFTYEFNPAKSYLGLAAKQFENKDYSGSILSVNNYLKHYPKSDFAYALRAKSRFMTADYTGAETDIAAALALNNDISYRLIEAKIAYQRGNFRSAKQKFEALAKDVQTSEIYKYIGLCDYAMKNYTGAALNFDKAIILSYDDKMLEDKYNEAVKKAEDENKNN